METTFLEYAEVTTVDEESSHLDFRHKANLDMTAEPHNKSHTTNKNHVLD
jgi:hypothetical protein